MTQENANNSSSSHIQEVDNGYLFHGYVYPYASLNSLIFSSISIAYRNNFW